MSTELLKSVFNDIYIRVYGVEYNFGNQKVEKLLDKFLSKIDFVVDEVWLYDFILFQFQYYRGMKSRFDKVYLNWIFGEAAWDRYKQRTEEQIYYADQYKKDLGIIITTFKPVNISDYEDQERRRFDSMDRQFLHCYENQLFSLIKCKFCQLYDVCKERK